jgi:hypothetical protein
MQACLIKGLGYVHLGGRDTKVTCQIIKIRCNEVYRQKNITEIRKQRSLVLYYRVIKKVSVHLMITILKVTSNVQTVPYQSPDIY